MMPNKYKALRIWSDFCQRWFASKMEAERGEELALMRIGKAIDFLNFQVVFLLSKKPKVTITIDFVYRENGEWVHEDTKGVLTRDFRTKLAWLKQLHGIEVKLTGSTRGE